LPGARLLLGDDFLQSRGYIYATAQWNKLVIERQRESGTLSDPTFEIDRGTDGYAVLRDLSDFLRRPKEVFDGADPPLPARNVMAFGGSQTGMLLRGFHYAGLNTTLPSTSSFASGYVFEGSLHFVPGGRCRAVTDVDPWFAYSFGDCSGETPERQGKVITINAETDVQIAGGWMARPRAATGSDDHYRLYEVAGVAHIPTPFIPLKQLGLREADGPEQNYVEMGPHASGHGRASSRMGGSA
jgi:hypothetical protein